MRKLSVLLSCLALGATGLGALAQDKKPEQPPAGERPPRGDRPGGGAGGGPGGGGFTRGPAMDPAKAKAAQELEATGVAKHAGLNEAQTKTLVTAYLAARASHAEASEKLRKELMDAAQNGDGGRPDFAAMQQKMQDLNKSEREKFVKALGSSIPAEQAAKVTASLGSFNAQWDRWVDALGEFKLDAGKQQDALNAIETYILDIEKVRAAGDREAMQEARQEAREKLMASMKKTLNDEQYGKFEQAMRPGGRAGPGGPGGGGEGGGQRRRNRDGGDNGGGGGGGAGGGGGGR